MTHYSFYQERREPQRIRQRVNVRPSDGSTGAFEVNSTVKASVTVPENPGAIRIVASDLYENEEALSPVLAQAFPLLRHAVKLADESVEILREDPIAADLCVQSLRPILRRLFMHREIGDGFGAIVDALISALDNNHGMPLDEVRLGALHSAILRLSEEPFLTFASAIHVIEDIEHAGFSTEPPGFEYLAGWLTG